MANRSAVDSNKSPEPPESNAAAPAVTKRTKEPTPPPPPYKPYANKELPGALYKPYAKKPLPPGPRTRLTRACGCFGAAVRQPSCSSDRLTTVAYEPNIVSEQATSSYSFRSSELSQPI
jgi:hypothetical protein